MIPQSTIDEAIKRLINIYNPLQMYLYGDYAWGKPTEESSWDVLVIIESSDKEVLERGYLAFEALLSLRIPQNVSVFTKEEFDKYVSNPTSTTYEIKTRGKVLFDSRYPNDAFRVNQEKLHKAIDMANKVFNFVKNNILHDKA